MTSGDLSDTFEKKSAPGRRYDQKFKPTLERHTPRVRSKRRRRFPRWRR